MSNDKTLLDDVTGFEEHKFNKLFKKIANDIQNFMVNSDI